MHAHRLIGADCTFGVYLLFLFPLRLSRHDGRYIGLDKDAFIRAPSLRTGLGAWDVCFLPLTKSRVVDSGKNFVLDSMSKMLDEFQQFRFRFRFHLPCNYSIRPRTL